MKAFLLAAGSGSRLRPLTDSVPKCLLPIQGTPLLEIWLENCHASGIDEVLINVHAHREKVAGFIGQHGGPVRVHLVEEEQLLGSAGTLFVNRDFVKNEESFFILYGDVLTNASLKEMLVVHKQRNLPATVGVCRVSEPQRCGVLSFDQQNIIRSFIEKPAKPESNWAFSGIMVATPQIIDLVPALRPADIGFHLLPQLVGRMAACPINAFLMDIGTMENYQIAQTTWPGLHARREGRACCRA